jgi:exosortase/archaeosortase family protein
MGDVINMIRQEKRRFNTIMVLVTAVILLMYRDDILGSFLAPLTMMTARATLVLLHWLGIEAVQVATRIYHPDGFVYEIYYRCTGFLPAAFLVIAILAYPRPVISKIWGLVVGVSVLMALNLTRLIHLFYLGVYHPAAFDFVHTILWRGGLILAIVCLWRGWIKWSRSH